MDITLRWNNHFFKTVESVWKQVYINSVCWLLSLELIPIAEAHGSLESFLAGKGSLRPEPTCGYI